MTQHVITWFEIPVEDFERAKDFYATLLDIEIPVREMFGYMMGFFPYDQETNNVTGAIVKGEGYKPSHEGALVYLSCHPDMQTILDRVEDAGGSIVTNRMKISDDAGYMAKFIDTKGNMIALHSME